MLPDGNGYRLVWQQRGEVFRTGFCDSNTAEEMYDVAKEHPHVEWANVEYITRHFSPQVAPTEQ